MKGGSEAMYIELCYVQRPRITLEAKKITSIQGVFPNPQNPYICYLLVERNRNLWLLP